MASVQESLDTTLGSAAENVIKTVKDPLKEEVKPTPVPEAGKIWTPKEVSSSPNGTRSTGKDSIGDMKGYLKEIALWEQPLQSAKILGVVVFVYSSTCCGSLVGFLCYLLFWRLVLVAGPKLAAAKLEKVENGLAKRLSKLLLLCSSNIESIMKLPTPEQVSFIVGGLASVIEEKTFAAADAIEKAGSDPNMLKICCYHLLGAQLILRFISLYNIVFIGLIVFLTVPGIYEKQKARIDPVLEQLKEKAKPHVEKAKALAQEALEKGQAKLSELVEKALQKYKEMREKRSGVAPTPAE